MMTSLKSGSDAPVGSPFVKHTLSPHTPFNKSRAMVRHWTESASEGSLMDIEAVSAYLISVLATYQTSYEERFLHSRQNLKSL